MQQKSLDAAKTEAARLQSNRPDKYYRVYRIKTTLEPSNAKEVVAALEKRIKELEERTTKPKMPLQCPYDVRAFIYLKFSTSSVLNCFIISLNFLLFL